MSDEPNDGGPAFARPAGPEPRVNEYHESQDGLSKLELFAAMAMQGMLAAYSRMPFPECEGTAKDAVEYAKSLLAELEKDR